MEKVTRNFLENKSFEHNVGWGAGVIKIESSTGNIYRLSDNVFYFTEYNFLPTDGSNFDGHYTFYVNYKTFDYLVYKNSNYGSLTYTTPTKEINIIKLNDIDKKISEAIIASKLLGSYFYDFDKINQEGELLIPMELKNSDELYLERYAKKCLICDFRNYLWSDFKPQLKTDQQYEVLSLIDKDFVKCEINEIKFYDFIKKDESYRFNISFICNNVKKDIILLRCSTYSGLQFYFIHNNNVLLYNSISIKNIKLLKENLKDCLIMLCENNLV